MKIKDYDFKMNTLPHCSSPLEEGVMVMDIETLGLSKSQPIYLIGYGYAKDEENGFLRQYLAEDSSQEEEILRTFLNDAAKFHTIMTFNGDQFDLPFLSARLQKYHLPEPILTSLDLRKEFRPLHSLFPMQSHRQRDFEDLLGFNRDDDMDGGALIKIYHQYASSKSSTLEQQLLYHNYLDVLRMFSLAGLLHYKDIPALLPNARIVRSEINDDSIAFQVILQSRESTTSENEAFLPTSETFLPVGCFLQNDYGFFKLENNTLSGSLKLYKDSFRLYLPNHRDYYYHLVEKTIFPKALCSGISREYLRNATKEECFVTDSGTFLEIPTSYALCLSDEGISIYHQALKDKKSYIKIDPNHLKGNILKNDLSHIFENIINQRKN